MKTYRLDIRTLSNERSVAAQIAAADLHGVHEASLDAIVCNRPDGEGTEPHNVGAIEHAAQARYLPAVSCKVTNDRGATCAARKQAPEMVGG